MANELADELKGSGRNIIRASVVGFHNPKGIRYSKGEDSPEGYYFDSFNHEAMAEVLLDPLSSGNFQYETAVFDYATDSEVVLPVQIATSDSILITEGIFLFRPELVKYWDLKIFIDVDFKIAVKRAIGRGTEREYIGAEQEITDRYNQRYIPGQKLYFKKANPKEQADIVIKNSDFENPIITKELQTAL